MTSASRSEGGDGGAPWDRNVGCFAVPSSTVPTSRPVQGATGGNGAFVASRLADARREGRVAVGADTIATRIDQAIAGLARSGLGLPRYITLTETDMLALSEVALPGEYREIRVSFGAGSRVYGRDGSQRIFKKVRT